MTLSEVPKGQPKADSHYFAKERFYSLFGRILSHRIDRQGASTYNTSYRAVKGRAITGPPFAYFPAETSRRGSAANTLWEPGTASQTAFVRFSVIHSFI